MSQPMPEPVVEPFEEIHDTTMSLIASDLYDDGALVGETLALMDRETLLRVARYAIHRAGDRYRQPPTMEDLEREIRDE